MITFNSSVYQERQTLEYVSDTLYLIKEVSFIVQDHLETTITRFIVVEKELLWDSEVENTISITLFYVKEDSDGFTEPQETTLPISLKDIITLFNKD